jgi:diketogulonate reductase-like aldo/keto reductase
MGGWSEHAKLAKSELYMYFTSKYKITSYAICLAWLLAKGKHIIPIPGTSKKEHVMMNFETINFKLECEDIKIIDEFPDCYLPQYFKA